MWRPARLVEAHNAVLDDFANREMPLDGVLVTRDLAQVMDSMIAAQTQVAYDIRSLPGVAGAVRLLAGHISGLELTQGSTPPPGWLLKPRSYGGALDLPDLLQYLVDSMLIHGKGYVMATCVAAGDRPSFRLDAVDPNYVQVNVRTDGLVGRTFVVAGTPVPEIPPTLASVRQGARYIVHIPYRVSVEAPEGTTPLVDAAPTLRGYVRTEEHASSLFDNGTYVGGVLTTTHDITPTQAQGWQDAWISARRTGKVAVLGNGLEYRNELADGVTLQMVESRSFAASSIYALLGIPQSIMGSSMMGGQSSLSYSNSQDNDRLYARNALRPIGEQITGSLSVLLPNGRNADEDQHIEFDYSKWETKEVTPGGDQGSGTPEPASV